MIAADSDVFSSGEFSKKLTEIAASGITGRGPSVLCSDRVWMDAVDLIKRSGNISLVSGFYVPAASAPETDGPAGTLSLARALLKLEKDVRVWTDSLCLECFMRCADEIGFPGEMIEDASQQGFEPLDTDLLIYIERLGRAADGRYYNMRKEDISAWTAPLDSFAFGGNIPVIAIGDGGNEVGMGNLLESLGDINPPYARCLCTVSSDVCIPVDVSNWGAYALVAALSFSFGSWLGQSDEEERAMLAALCECGVVDGVTKMCEMSVDGLGLNEQIGVLSSLRSLVSDVLK